LVVSGDVTVLSDTLQKAIKSVEEKTSKFLDRTLNIALNYGGRQEIVTASNNLIKKGVEITEKTLTEELSTRGIPDIDLVIRTSGEQRISNFYLWQIAYAELYFTEVLWPELDKNEFDKALSWYSSRNRRFGKL
jgi:undecaprenyl diphosphate synthase